jgi:hypothetical protein
VRSGSVHWRGENGQSRGNGQSGVPGERRIDEIGGQMAEAGQHPHRHPDGQCVDREGRRLLDRGRLSELGQQSPNACLNTDRVQAKEAQPSHQAAAEHGNEQIVTPDPMSSAIGRWTKGEREAIPIRQGGSNSSHEHKGPTVAPMTTQSQGKRPAEHAVFVDGQDKISLWGTRPSGPIISG